MSNRHIIIEAQGAAKIADVPIPRLRDDYILVETHAVALNPTDWKHIDFMASPGARLGCDYAGVVVKVGSAVTQPFKKGDRVAGPCHGANAVCHDDGTFGQIITVKGDVQITIPENLSFEDGATLGIAVTTTGQALYQNLQLPLPDAPEKATYPVLIYGASAAVGALAVQFAKLSGAFVIATCSPHNADYVKSLGADVVLDYKSATVVNDIKHAAGDGLKHALDCISEDKTATICAGAMSEPGGRLALLQPVAAEVISGVNKNVTSGLTVAYTVVGESFSNGPYEVPAIPENLEFGKKFWALTRTLLEQGKLRAHRSTINPTGSDLEGVLKGIGEMRAGKVTGKKWVYTIPQR